MSEFEEDWRDLKAAETDFVTGVLAELKRLSAENRQLRAVLEKNGLEAPSPLSLSAVASEDEGGSSSESDDDNDDAAGRGDSSESADSDSSSSEEAEPPLDVEAVWAAERALSVEERRARYRCGTNFREALALPLWSEQVADHMLPAGEDEEEDEFEVNDAINAKIVLTQGDVTKLEIDATVNAANERCLGGGGIDGAIHTAAGPRLYDECLTLNGCPTGQTKITRGYNLPGKFVLHTVGPRYTDDALLTSCYETVLQHVAEQDDIRSVAMCGISTGIFGFPLERACRIALGVTRRWLEVPGNMDKVDRIVFCNFLDKEVAAYERNAPHFFPGVRPEPVAAGGGDDDCIFVSKYDDVEVPTGVSISEFILAQAQEHGDKVALVDGPTGQSCTFNQVNLAARKVAATLAARGLAEGETVALIAPNCPEYAFAFHGTILANGVVTTANPLYTAQEFSHQLVSSKAKFVITVAPFEEKVAEAIKLAGDDCNVQEVFVFGKPTAGATPFAALLAGDAADCPKFTRDSKTDTAVLPYSSGTTGLPKGVELTHENLISNILQLRAVESAMGPDDVFLGLLPFFHIYGMVVILNAALYIGAKVVTVPKFEPESFLTTVQKYKLTILHLVPPIVLFLAKHPVVDKFDLTSVKLIFCGAAPLGAELSAAATKRLNGCRVKQGYGMTETSPVTHINPDDDIVDGSAGVLVPNMQARIVDVESGESQPAGEEHTGELWVKGPNVMKGYLNNPEATASTVDADGWLHTGDIAYVDESGNFFIVDRLKELIKYKGFQVPPAELEALLLTHEAIADAAVIGIPDEEAGELPKAFIVLKPDQKLDAEGVNAFLEPQIAPHKKLRGGVEFTDAIPKSASGKILRRELKALEAERASASGSGSASAAAAAASPAPAAAPVEETKTADGDGDAAKAAAVTPVAEMPSMPAPKADPEIEALASKKRGGVVLDPVDDDDDDEASAREMERLMRTMSRGPRAMPKVKPAAEPVAKKAPVSNAKAGPTAAAGASAATVAQAKAAAAAEAAAAAPVVNRPGTMSADEVAKLIDDLRAGAADPVDVVFCWEDAWEPDLEATLAGDFSDWREVPVERGGAAAGGKRHAFAITLPLDRGQDYKYRFTIDGKPVRLPTAPSAFGPDGSMVNKVTA